MGGSRQIHTGLRAICGFLHSFFSGTIHLLKAVGDDCFHMHVASVIVNCSKLFHIEDHLGCFDYTPLPSPPGVASSITKTNDFYLQVGGFISK